MGYNDEEKNNYLEFFNEYREGEENLHSLIETLSFLIFEFFEGKNFPKGDKNKAKSMIVQLGKAIAEKTETQKHAMENLNEFMSEIFSEYNR